MTNDETFLLDLLNSAPVVDGIEHDALGTAASARAWLRGHGSSGSSAEWHATRAARDLLQEVVRGVVPAASLTAVLDGATSRPAIDGDSLVWTLDVAAPRRQAVRAVVAWDELRRSSPGRLRACANPDCALFLIDHSKPNSARWCSMAVCGNRMKARRHYERSRSNGS